MFGRFTDDARQVVVLAQDEARRLNHPCVGTEHLLLGMVREGDGVAARALAELGIALGPLRPGRADVGAGDAASDRPIPFTPRTMRVIELAKDEAEALGHTYIATEHLLLGLVREHEGVGARVLDDHGADAETIRSAVARILSGSGRGPATVAERSPHLVLACPDCGEPIETVAPDRANAPFHMDAEDDRTCPRCGAAWRVTYSVTWERQTP